MHADVFPCNSAYHTGPKHIFTSATMYLKNNHFRDSTAVTLLSFLIF